MTDKNFTCERCGFVTAYKCSLIQHLSNKTPCPTTHSSISCDDHIAKLKQRKLNEKTYACIYCKKQFNDNGNRHRHQHICPQACAVTDLQKQVDDLKKQLEIMAAKQSNSVVMTNTNSNNTQNNSNNTTNINNSQNVNIIVNDFGNENRSYLTKEFLTKCLRKQNQGIVDLIKALHFNPDHQENNNLKIANKKLPYIEKFYDARWQYCDKNEIIDELIKAGFEILDEHQYDNEEELKQMMSRRIFEGVDEWLSNVRDKEKETITPLRRDIYLVILNNSYMVLTK